MIAADSSTWIAFGAGQPGEDCERLHRAIADHAVFMAPPVLAELYSAPRLQPAITTALGLIPLLEIQPGFWQRAGELRARVLARGRKARLGDALIAQCCLDHDVALVTRDRDFVVFAQAAGLALLLH